MPLNLTGPEGLFTRLGHLISSVNLVNTYRGSQLSDRVDITQEDYSNSDQHLVNNLYSQLVSVQRSHTAMINYWKTLAQNTVTQMINNYQPQLKNTYPSALAFLINYLINNHHTVSLNNVSVTITPGSGNQGNGIVFASPLNGLFLPQEYMFNEPALARVTRDYQGGATPGQETLQFTGIYGTTDVMNWLWPQGSNAAASVTAISPETSGGVATKNWLTNGMMELFTANVPTGWSVKTGTPGTSILKDNTTFYDGANSLRFVGDGSEITAIRSQFGVDFSGTPIPGDQFVVNLWYKLGTTAGSAVLRISLVDGAGTTLIDRSGNPAALSVNLGGVDTNWHTLTGLLGMPSVLPSAAYIMISTSTSLPTGKTLNIDRVTLARPSLFYSTGPQIACFSGNSKWMVGDTYQVQTSNAYNGLIQTGSNQLLNLNRYGYILPSTSVSPTIPDSLVS